MSSHIRTPHTSRNIPSPPRTHFPDHPHTPYSFLKPTHPRLTLRRAISEVRRRLALPASSFATMTMLSLETSGSVRMKMGDGGAERTGRVMRGCAWSKKLRSGRRRRGRR
jgi:hypothetical protein